MRDPVVDYLAHCFLHIDPTDTYICNVRKQQNQKTELRKLSEALQHLQDKRLRYKLLYKKECEYSYFCNFN